MRLTAAKFSNIILSWIDGEILSFPLDFLILLIGALILII